jgi:hypothetical protein
VRDFERLEELSFTVQSGLRSNDVIWAIDQVLAGQTLDEPAKASLICGREILRDWSEHGAMVDPDEARRSQSMLGSEGRAEVQVLVFASHLDEEVDDEKASEDLRALARSLEAVSAGEPADEHRESLETAVEVFSQISEIKLGQANGIVRARRERTTWTPPTTISTFS